MKEITIMSKSPIGDTALKQHIEEAKKLSFKDRLIFKTAGYKQEVIGEEPYTILLTVNNRFAGNPMFFSLIQGEIEKAFKDNGADKDTDYTLEVK